MTKSFLAFFLAATFFLTSFAEIDVPYCREGQTDPASSHICGTGLAESYGYEGEWNVTIVQNLTAKYLPVNGKWPPPTVDIHVGQRIRIKLNNQINGTEPVTLHFHGLLQENGYTVMDGPQGPTQSPVMPGQSFTYDFPVNQAGTYWIHSHATGQYPKGLRSPLIVRDSSEPALLGYNANRDYLVTLSDWYPNFWDSENVYRSNTCGGGVEPASSRVMVGDNATEWGHGRTNADNSYLLAPTETARFRFVNLGAFARFYIHFNDFRQLKVVEVDGILLEGTWTRGIELSSGQRVSIVVSGSSLSSPESARLVYISDPRIGAGGTCGLTPSRIPTGSEVQVGWSWVDSVSTSATRNPAATSDFNNTLELKTWKTSDIYGNPYFGNRPKVNFTIQKRNYPAPNNAEYWIPNYVWNFNDAAFVPRDGQTAWMVDNKTNPLKSVIHTIMLVNDSIGHGTMGLSTAARDYPTSLWTNPEAPPYDPNQASSTITGATTLLRVLKQGTTEADLKSPLTYSDFAHTIVLSTHNETHWLPIATNPATGNPYRFNYTGYYQDIYNKVLVQNENRPGNKAVSRRDTLTIEKGWDYVIALKSDNPGVWAMHCHNDFHASTSMFMQIVEQPIQLRNLLGTWYLGSHDRSDICTKAGGVVSNKPVYSTLGTNTQRYWNLYGVTGKLWGQFSQAIMGSFGYYGVPETCFGLG
ncbi:Cupredoxin [Rhexocercosporidium sp. MPI-PUGE-AT-0058]|nr:Cupredoxin [Rhexocercosporidium sp. MPI-PUGE-AT-0058]